MGRDNIEQQLLDYFSGNLPESARKAIEQWVKASPENKDLFKKFRKNFLDMMEKMGITEKDRRKLILFETLAILLRALIAAAVVTVILVLIARIVFALALPSAKEYASCLVYALPAYLLCALALTLIMLLIFAFISVGEKGGRARVKFKHKES